MKYILRITLILFLVGTCFSVAEAHINPKHKEDGRQANTIEHREACDPAVDQTDQAINNVRARLLTGGDVWWDGGDGRYVVPKVPAGQPEVSSIFAGAVWLGGVDPAGNLKVAAQMYGRSSGRADFWTGPIDPVLGTTDSEVCAVWDRFFKVTGEEIDEHIRNYDASINEGKAYAAADIPRNIRGWPARGNDFFFDVHGFELPNTNQGLAGFWDRDGDGRYDPDLGDYPVIEVRGCDEPQYPDEMTFWIYNDAGNIHSQSQGDPIQMEIQVQAFAYATNDEINDMTFQRYKLINRAIESIDSMFFAMWVDPDLGCYTDDYVGCDTLRSLAFVYNADAVDGETGCNCPQGVNTYCEEVPILGIDYFRGPLDELGNEIGMSSFTYFNNPGLGSPPPGTTDPNNATEYYNYLSGSWRDGTPFTFGDDAYQDGEEINFAFIGDPSQGDEWSMCSERTDPSLDRRTLQATGPFRLDPGAVNELIIGVVWVADQLYPCPSLRELQNADDIAQALFDNCFEITDGPDAPDLDFIELDQELIAVFTNDALTSNNAFEAYAEKGLRIPSTVDDTLYRFEGYKMYQLAGPDVTLADLDDPNKARLVVQVDIKNGVNTVFNWEEVESPLEDEAFFAPVPKVEGKDDGIRHTFRLTQDQFASGDDPRLVNHKKYYYTTIAYAYNNYLDYDPVSGIGQKELYLEGRKNIGDGVNPFYTVIPRPITYTKLNAEYGTGVEITRIDGVGAGANFLNISDATRNAIVDGSFDGNITYEQGGGPIEVNIFNPLEVKNGEFILTFVDSDLSDDNLESTARWVLTDVDRGEEIASETTIERLNEQILGEYGFTITIGQTDDAGSNIDDSNGAIGVELEYAEGGDNNWFFAAPDDTRFNLNPIFDNVLNFASTSSGQPDAELDPKLGLTQIGGGWIPYTLCDWRARPEDQFGLGYITPAWTQSVGGNGGSLVRNGSDLADLNNVDVVFTSDKSKWSRCAIVQSGNQYYDAQGLKRDDANRYFELRNAPSVGKEAGADGLPMGDGDGMGMGWFPGYAVDVETGERLNIFFGENTYYDDEQAALAETTAVGNDMMWNPSREFIYPSVGQSPDLAGFIMGGQHFIYVTKLPYDGCESIRARLEPSPSPFRKLLPLQNITWTCLPLADGITSYAEGLIPNDLVVKLRVDNPYQIAEGTGEYNGYPTYKFKLEGFASEDVTGEDVETALDMINVAPNPYYGYSAYETSQFSNIVKITNLPAKCVVTIYSLDGKFIRQYDRDEIGSTPEGNNRAVERSQINPDIEWDLKNAKGIPVASGVYLIHINSPELGERVIKWFGVAREFDPSGL